MEHQKFLPGTLVIADFPFEEAGWSRLRPAMVLRDIGDEVVLIYCTTNPAGPRKETVVRLGPVFDGRVTNLVPVKWAVIKKSGVKNSQRIELPTPGLGKEVFSRLAREATRGAYGDHGMAFLRDLPQTIAYANAHAAKKAKKAA